METEGRNGEDVDSYIGSSGRVSEILNRKQMLTLDMIRKLHSGLNIPLESLFAPVSSESR